MGYASAIGRGGGARTAADLVKERNARQMRAEQWRAEHPGPLSDDMTFRIGQWIEQGGLRAPWEPEPPTEAVYPPVSR
jgi:hypothetical protein